MISDYYIQEIDKDAEGLDELYEFEQKEKKAFQVQERVYPEYCMCLDKDDASDANGYIVDDCVYNFIPNHRHCNICDGCRR